MTIEQLRRAKDAEPFRPFDICTVDGQQIRVGHPECMMVPPKAERTFVVAHDDLTYQVIDLLLVSTLDFGNARQRGNSRPPRNGAGR